MYTPIVPAYSNIARADEIRTYINARIFSPIEWDQFLAMDIIDITRSNEFNLGNYINEYMIEFDML